MKTSVIDVHALLSALSLEEVEQRIGEVPGVESVTVNYAAGNATVRFDETRLDIGHLKSTVRQRGHDPAAPAAASARDGNEDHIALAVPPATRGPAQKTAPPTTAGTAQRDKVIPPIKPDPSPVEAAPKSPPEAAPAAPAGSEPKDNAATEKVKS